MNIKKLIVALIITFSFAYSESDPVDDQIEQLLLVRDTILKTLDSVAEKEGIKNVDMKELCYRWREALYDFVQKSGFSVDKEGWIKLGDNEYVKYDDSCRVHKKTIEIAVAVDEEKKQEIKARMTHEPLPKKDTEPFRMSGYRFVALIMLIALTVIFGKGIVDSLIARRGTEALVRILVFIAISSIFAGLMKLLP
ncbi:hypothetical protein [Hydrogenivirga sp.]